MEIKPNTSLKFCSNTLHTVHDASDVGLRSIVVIKNHLRWDVDRGISLTIKLFYVYWQKLIFSYTDFKILLIYPTCEPAYWRKFSNMLFTLLYQVWNVWYATRAMRLMSSNMGTRSSAVSLASFYVGQVPGPLSRLARLIWRGERIILPQCSLCMEDDIDNSSRYIV